jgi:hypothetical protein
MAAQEIDEAAAGQGAQFQVCYVTRGYGVKSGSYEYRWYLTEDEAIVAARKALVEGLEPGQGRGGLAHVDEAHIRIGSGPWRLLVSREQPQRRSALSLGAEFFLPRLGILRS